MNSKLVFFSTGHLNLTLKMFGIGLKKPGVAAYHVWLEAGRVYTLTFLRQ